MNDLTPQPVRARTIQRAQEMKFGTELTSQGVRFRLWAPECDHVSLRLEGVDPLDRPMTKLPRGWFEHEEAGAAPGTRYRFVLPDGTPVPDPASRYQPEDTHGPSEVVDPRAFGWTDEGWRGRPWEESVLYELHVGTFTTAGTFLSAIDRLDDLADLGITAIELMPLADFQGRWNWGYDGVLHFAPDASYGRPEDLKALIDAAHARSMMVLLDVVYNHFGPDGNYMGLYAPILTDKHETPWGPAVNFDDDGSAMVREYVVANARYWLNEFHFDGLRFDAVHAIEDTGPQHLLKDLAEKLRTATDGRHIHLVIENSENQAGWLKRRKDLTPGLYTAQWSDDVHHCLHCAATGESHWYYADFHGRIDLLARSLAQGLGYQGERTQHEGKDKGEPSAHLPPAAFVTYIQNHDQVGNRPFGDRLTALASTQAVRSLAVVNILSPHIPLLFMGEEWGAKQPFMFFADVGDELSGKVREGRRKEFEDSPDAKDTSRTPPDPVAEGTFLACKLDWSERTEGEHADWLSFYTRLIDIRRREIVPRLAGIEGYAGHYEVIADRAIKVWWTLADGAVLTTIANLSPEPIDRVNPWDRGRHLWLEGTASGTTLEPWSVVVSLTDAKDLPNAL
jgi:maltooligosyltrehalose trehalohydrolase